jgi:hypothetical protein
MWTAAPVLLALVLLPRVSALGAPDWWGPLAQPGVYIFAVIAVLALAAATVVFRAPPTATALGRQLLAGCLVMATAGLGYVAYKQQATWHGGILQTRNFFGVKSIIEDQSGLWFKHGVTFHGLQFRDPRRRLEPTLYFGRASAIGLLLDGYPRPERGELRVGVVGLGIATLAAYGREGDYYRFYEIDPQVAAFSMGAHAPFTFLREAKARWDLVMGDARLMLERELERGDAQRFDILVLDAFSSDSVPVHLLTREALVLYLKHLRGPDSVLAFNVSNRHVDLAPMLLRAAREHQLAFAALEQSAVSRWVFMSRNAERIRISGRATRAVRVPDRDDLQVWTDNFSNLFDVLRR